MKPDYKNLQRSNVELKITGALNAEIYFQKSRDEMEKFVCDDANAKALKFVSLDVSDVVSIRSEYVVIDCRLNVQGTLYATIDYTHAFGSECKWLNFIKSCV